MVRDLLLWPCVPATMSTSQTPNQMRSSLRFVAAVAALVPSVLSAQVGLDGAIGADWTGSTAKQVNYSAAALNGNFGAPDNINTPTGYEIFMRRDANWLYTALRTTAGRNSGGLLFANLYYGLRFGAGPFGSSGGSTLSFEVTNDRAFLAGSGPYFNDNASNLIQYATTSVGGVDIFESAIHLSAFTGNALGVTGYVPDASAVGIRLNLSQSFGYSVAGGQTNYGDERLGFVPLAVVPEPSTYALMAAGLAALGLVARRRRAL